ncbi:hypothetical protein [Streptomyces sp. NPDC053542]|uniref:hypothetical protein n=1 Tax=Streptomyces sp. NPDC053542 TaxID=3365710 RepID=UPI0037D5C00D
MTPGKGGDGRAARADRTARTAKSAPARFRTDLLWLLFNGACVAVSVSLMWFAPVVPLPGALSVVASLTGLLVPLALILVPLLVPRRSFSHKTPPLTVLALAAVFLSAVGLAGITHAAGEERALEMRGRWTEAVVDDVADRKTDKCTLVASDGWEISPRLSQGDGCDADWVEPGDKMRVLYDPEEVADPVEKSEADLDSDSYRGGGDRRPDRADRHDRHVELCTAASPRCRETVIPLTGEESRLPQTAGVAQRRGCPSAGARHG